MSVCASFGWLSVSNQAENWVLASFLDEFRLGTIKLSVPADPRDLAVIIDSVHATAENSLYGFADRGSGLLRLVLARF